MSRLGAELARLAPGFVVVLAGLAAAVALHAAVPSISRLIAAVVIGALIGNVGGSRPITQPGLTFTVKRVMRVGVVLLGFRLSVGQITDLGVVTLAIVVGTVLATFVGTQWVGRRMGLSSALSLLVGTGFGICGLSAIAAVEDASGASEEEVAAAMGLVTLFGTLAIFAVPFAGDRAGLSDEQLGTWVGASVHDTAQVVAAASAVTLVNLRAARRLAGHDA
ncbi:MAG: putative sulfate exporter family transporter, partial [Actinomycetota bacterium]